MPSMNGVLEFKSLELQHTSAVLVLFASIFTVADAVQKTRGPDVWQLELITELHSDGRSRIADLCQNDRTKLQKVGERRVKAPVKFKGMKRGWKIVMQK